MRWRMARHARRHADGLLLAGGLIMDQNGRVLLLHRATPSLTQWETPGGKIEHRERPEQAAVRELREELGVEVEVVGDLGTHLIGFGESRLTYALFEVKVLQGTPQVAEHDKFDEARFFAWQELAELRDQLSPNARNLLRLELSGSLKRRPVDPVSTRAVV